VTPGGGPSLTGMWELEAVPGHLTVELRQRVDAALAGGPVPASPGDVFAVASREAARLGAGSVTVAVHPTDDATDGAAQRAGFQVIREMFELRRPLPLTAGSDGAAPVPLRPFEPGADDDNWVAVNHRAFEWHPDQGDWDLDELRRRVTDGLTSGWFTPEGFLVHDRGTPPTTHLAPLASAPAGPGEPGGIDGFCWTKVHPATGTEPARGEIYVIGVDPDAHGLGLGRALVIAGLNHLAGRGLEHAMLYVEADNAAGRALYGQLGFTTHATHRWYRRELLPTDARGYPT